MISKIYQLCSVYFNLVVFNLLWILGVVFGLVFLGFFPATVSLFSLYKQEKENFNSYISPIYLLREYATIYKKEFGKANLLGVLVILISAFLWLDYRLVITQSDLLSVIVKYVLFIVILVSVIAVMMLFPIYLHYDLNLKKYIIQTYIISLLSMREFFLLAVTLFGFYLGMFYLPAFLLPIYMSLQVKLVSDIMEKRLKQLQIFEERSDGTVRKKISV